MAELLMGAWRGCWMAAALFCASNSSQAADSIPLADFFRHTATSSAVMSPNGKYVAVLMPGGPDKRKILAVVDVDNFKASKAVASLVDADIADVWWVNNERLVFNIMDSQAPLGEQPGEGLFAVDRDGRTPLRRLIKPRQYFVTEREVVGDRSLSWQHTFFSTVSDGSGDVIVKKWLFDANRDWSDSVLLRVNTLTGMTTAITEGAPRDTKYWVVDRKGIPRVVTASKDGKSSLYWKPQAESPQWTLVSEYGTYRFDNELPDLIGIGDDGTVLGIGRARGENTNSLLQLQIQGSAVQAQPLLSLKGFDFAGEPVYGKDGKLLGVHYLSDAPDSHWYDPRLEAIQRKVDALLPSTNNRISCGECAEPSTVLVRATSDHVPPIFLLYDVAANKLEVMARARPWIEPSTMASREMHRFAARDGLEIPVHVTRPRGVKGPAPAILLVHGGPWVRGGSWRWDADSQFLASRGYVVIEPEFRGSTGYGRKLFKAGFKQWGLAMQDDLVDATEWAARQGFIDPKRVCIAGASYGGYAVLMGLIRDPQRYRCGVEWVGVSDIDLMYSINWSDFDETWKRYGMPALIGDRQKDAAQLAATSPLKRAAELKRPLLMAYGSDDTRVPLDHGTRFRDALKADNADLEFVVYPGEGHGWMLESTRVDFWSRVERFLAKHLAPPP